ncbi:hypothetical protein RJZ56_005672 [Blastomyces dermatitidis]|uniref:RNA polymerase II transcriptional coactivator n=2 Tax=Ajellomyces dermatitidis TaxID=5039 RepID=F2TPJ4_AJEDA|nr:RNA polymerase II transcriptional coactivator [Blastomyces dermatitidis ER-3]EEQ83505.1 RNA polymerase II transcriptional coactivator [Blastomyces dermatitidis ER-3]EGE85157.1 RNA polymerase II transcriptional coactivator [Blastomyces dermatitidis ATCC 18188]EQL31931.1 hypothetical protein BDFG_05825 [Blastomyces dermatitidis ATCC 26199]
MAPTMKRHKQNNGGEAPQHKRPRTDNSSSVASPEAGTTIGTSFPTSEKKIDSNGDFYWNISRFRRLTVSSFKGRTMVSVREYYEKDGQELPGKKGISMPLEQFNAMVQLLPNVEAVIKEKGGSLDRPNYIDGEGKEIAKNDPVQEDSGSESDESEDN